MVPWWCHGGGWEGAGFTGTEGCGPVREKQALAMYCCSLQACTTWQKVRRCDRPLAPKNCWDQGRVWQICMSDPEPKNSGPCRICIACMKLIVDAEACSRARDPVQSHLISGPCPTPTFMLTLTLMPHLHLKAMSMWRCVTRLMDFG